MFIRCFLCYFILGIPFGFILFNFLQNTVKFPCATNSNDPEFIQKVTETKISRRPKILCLILTGHKFQGEKAIHIRSTWGRHCDKLVFVSNRTDPNMDVIGFNVIDDHDHLWGKIKLAFKYIYENFIDDYDWIYKGDDDTFAILENMRYMLASYSPQKLIYFGHRLKTKEHKYGYFSGGSGYVMSNAATRLFVEKILSNVSLCDVLQDTGPEDWNIGKCLEIVEVHLGDGRDAVKRERFLPFPPETHLFSSRDYQHWHFSYNYTSIGQNCCSNYTISTHYISPPHMYALYYLTYHLHSMGVKRKFPPMSIEHFTSVKMN